MNTDRERRFQTAEAISRRLEALDNAAAITESAMAHTRAMFDHMCELADLTAEHLLNNHPEVGARGLVAYLGERRPG